VLAEGFTVRVGPAALLTRRARDITYLLHHAQQAPRQRGLRADAAGHFRRQRVHPLAGLVVSPVDRTSGGRRRYRELDLKWIIICTKLRATGMPIRGIRRYAGLVAAGPGNEAERLALLESHRADVLAKLAEIQENLKIIDHKIDVYRGSLAAGDADRLWAPVSTATLAAAD
jgi:DNA-binding transcriptional MerR regulator